MIKSVLVLMCIITTTLGYSQKSAVQIKNERWLKERKNSETHWKYADVKDLLEQKLDLSKISKLETQKWIIEKLNSYSKTKNTRKGMGFWDPIQNKTAYIYYTDEVISKRIYFDDKYLVFYFEYRATSTNSTPKYETRIDSVYIPNIKTIDYNESSLIFRSFDDRFFDLAFDFDRETEIGFRMKKALVHLCSFYWKPVANESF